MKGYSEGELLFYVDGLKLHLSKDLFCLLESAGLMWEL